MKLVGLFAGVGGMETGLARAGHKTLAVSEIWAPACAVLKERIGAPNLGDVQQIKALPEDTELLAAGFPCQDLSQAGFTRGIDGKRSGLVGAVFDLLDRNPVPWVLLENVSFMLRLDQGRAMTRLTQAFEERGYRWAYRVVNSLAFLPQRRERVFLLASKTGNPADVLFADEAYAPPQVTELHTHAHGFYWTEGVRGLGWGADCIPTLKNGSTIGIASPPAILLPSGAVITPDIRDAERLQGFGENWTRPAETVGRGSLRWSLVGNAVAVPVAEWIGRRLRDPGNYDSARDRALERSWPRAARGDGHGRVEVAITALPTWEIRSPLHEFLRYEGKPLSARATAGFLKRTARGSLRFPAGFLDRMRAHLELMEARPLLAA
jgi:DNA (cytosine-5)-methyltransferase 1